MPVSVKWHNRYIQQRASNDWTMQGNAVRTIHVDTGEATRHAYKLICCVGQECDRVDRDRPWDGGGWGDHHVGEFSGKSTQDGFRPLQSTTQWILRGTHADESTAPIVKNPSGKGSLKWFNSMPQTAFPVKFFLIERKGHQSRSWWCKVANWTSTHPKNVGTRAAFGGELAGASNP